VVSLALALAAARSPAGAADCTFAALEWNAEGTALRFTAGDSSAAQLLQVDLQSGVVTSLEPRVRDASWSPVSRRVLCRDDFGVYDLDLQAPKLRPLAFLPAVSRTFLRALGNDERGALLLWTIQRDSGEHAFWRRTEAGLERFPGVFAGAEALRWWDEHNVAQPFALSSGSFVRSTCVERRSGQRLCLERPSASAAFRFVLAAPERVDVVVDRCLPNALAVNSDSSLVVVGLYEELDAKGGSQVVTLWLSDLAQATRLSESFLPRPARPDGRQQSGVHWLDRTQCLWADAVGQLFRVQAEPARATPLVSLATAGAATRTVRRPGDGEESAAVAGPGGGSAFLRHHRGAHGMRSEIWVSQQGAAARLLVPAWDDVPPVSVP